MTSETLTIIKLHPGIDAPELCIKLYLETHDKIPDIVNHELALWLSENHSSVWGNTCNDLDILIEEGLIVFTDDGNLYPVGYQGDML